MLPAPSSPPVVLNAWLGLALALANAWLLHYYLFNYEVSENDQVLYLPVWCTCVAAQWGLLARYSPRPWQVVFAGLAGLTGLAAAGLWFFYLWLQAFAHGFNH